MKNLSLITLSCAALLLGCSTTQETAFRAVADPVTVALISGYGASQGLPPALTAPILTALQGQAWGIYNQVAKLQPAADGASIPAVGSAVAATNPTPAQLITAINTLTVAKSNPALASQLLAAAAPKSTGSPGPSGGDHAIGIVGTHRQRIVNF